MADMNEHSGELSGSRIPPQAVDVERSVLGAMLIDREALPRALEVLDNASFYNPTHQKYFNAMIALFEKGEPIDAVTLVEELRRRGQLNPTEDPVYIAQLTMNVSSSANVEYHARIVLEKALKRGLISSSTDIVSRAYNETEDALDLLDDAETKIFQISERRLKKAATPIKRALSDTFEMLQTIHGQHGGVTGVPSGFSTLDDLSGGFQNSDLIIIAGRPSQGKTAFALAIARNAATDRTKPTPVAIFSIEMAEQQLAVRMLASEARVDAHKLRTGRLPDEEWTKLSRSVGRLAQAKIFIDDTPALGILELRAKSRRLKAEHGIGMVIVDYLQLISGPKSSESREREISMISRSLKALAKEINIPVIALSQLNRAVEGRSDKRPMLADLRECVTGETLVHCSDGQRIPICELVDKEVDLFSINKKGKVTVARSEKIWSVGKKPIFRITLASGRTIRTTAEHRLLGASGWTTVKELQSGNRLAIARTIPEPNECLTLPDEKLVMLAHLIGDGSYIKHQPLRYTTASEDNSKAVSDAAVSFGVTVTRHKGKGNWHQLVFSGNGNRWHPRGVNLWLRELGIYGQRSHEKRIPPEIFRLSNEQLALFLRHLWATDGSISLRGAKSRGSARIFFATCSEVLARDVASLLLRFGIVTRIRSSRKAQYKPVYSVDVSGSAQQKIFLEKVGTFGPRKLPGDRLHSLLSDVIPNTNVDTLPKEIFLLVKQLMKERGISQRAMASLRGTTYGGTSHFRFAPSREVLAGYAQLLHSEKLRQLAASDLFWDTIVNIAPDGDEEVFDLTVPGTSSWLADNIISHNSGAIEQDADVVLFVHRPEMYGITEVKDEDGTPIPTEGVAEIIIGKQRNGPTGIIRLSFRKEYAGFERLAHRALEVLAPPPPSNLPENIPF